MGTWAYIMTKTDFYGIVFHSWMQPMSVDLARYGIESQELSVLFAGLVGMESSAALRWVVAGAIALTLFFFILPDTNDRLPAENCDGQVSPTAGNTFACYEHL